MIDAMTQDRLSVSNIGTAGPYIRVPVSQLNELRQLLDRHGISYSVDQNAISLNGKPEVTVVNLGRNANGQKVQEILDSVH
ncbi:MAG: hypothetical protein CVV27_06445 [Candidatus Melainabacteria bacterium HGW-Melainabacteria-1]|nr:MAG: hypothetical protein CVV27_06445 [Candidatus Melainabacteria bacterium HGW-Melainabacteria-1]